MKNLKMTLINEDDSLTPGYRWLELEYNGNIKTGIDRLPMSEVDGTNDKFLYS